MFLFPSRETPKWTHRTEFIDELIAVPRQKIRSENALNLAINKQPQLLANFREREKERVAIEYDHNTTEDQGVNLCSLAHRLFLAQKSKLARHRIIRRGEARTKIRKRDIRQLSAWEPRPAIISRNPDRNNVSTSYIERQNLTMPMSMRRF